MNIQNFLILIQIPNVVNRSLELFCMQNEYTGQYVYLSVTYVLGDMNTTGPDSHISQPYNCKAIAVA